MATSEVQICNMALGRIGCSQFISSLDDASNEARVCNQVYTFVLERVLQDFPWPFATKYATLADIGTPVSPWGFRYRYPSDCLQIHRVLFESKTEGVPYAVINDDASDAKAILCDYETAVIEYTANVTKVSLFPPSFSNALAWAIASEIAAPLSADPKYAQAANNTYSRTLAEAGALAYGESKQDTFPDGELLTSRESS